jgi:hypothetical protein
MSVARSGRDGRVADDRDGSEEESAGTEMVNDGSTGTEEVA